jgi:transcriptional regulator with XRE-family HTH domain
MFSGLRPNVAALQLLSMTTIEWGLGDVVRALRDRQKLTQQKLADKADMNKATIVSVEKMDRNHGRETYRKIAHALGLTSEADLYALIPKETQREAPAPSTTGTSFRSPAKLKQG